MVSNCIVCGSKEIVKKNTLSREGKNLDIFHCQNCLHVFQTPDNYVDIYTTGEFTKIARSEIQYTPEDSKIKQLDKKAFDRVKFYSDILENNFNNVLEIGSSIGSFVSNLKLMGKEAYGLEPDPGYANYSKTQYNFEQYCSVIEDFYPKKQFDAFCSFHVLEHTANPINFVEQIARLAKPKAKLLFELPSYEIHAYGDMKSTIWGPHFQYFTASSLYTLFSKKFKVIKVGYYGSSLFIYAEKSDTSTFNNKTFSQFKRQTKRVLFLSKYFPKYKVKNKVFVSQLLLQPFFQKEISKTFTKAKEFAAYGIKESQYVKSEKRASHKTKFSHLTYYRGWENTGDTVLSKCVRDVFNREHKLAWNLNKVTDPVNESLINSINNTKALVIGGGGLLLPDTNENSKSGWQWAASKEQIESIKVPILLYAIGYNYFKGQKPNDLFIENLNHIVEKADFVGLRNNGSIKKVQELINPNLKDKLVFQPCPTTIIRKLYNFIPNKESSKNIGVNIAYDRYERRFGGEMHSILDKIAIGLKKLSDAGYTIYNICHLNSDAKFELNLKRRSVNYKTVYLNYFLPKEVYRFYNNMELVMGMRGHAQMIPFGLNCRIVTLGTHDKMKWFLDDIDAADWYINIVDNIDQLDTSLVEKSLSILNDTLIYDRLIQQQEKLFSITQENQKLIFEKLK